MGRTIDRSTNGGFVALHIYYGQSRVVLLDGAWFTDCIHFPRMLEPLVLSSCRSRLVPSAARGLLGGVSQATRAVRDIARVRLCADIDSFLRAVSVVMAADFDGEEGGDTAEPFRDETAGGILPEGFTSKSLSEVTSHTRTARPAPGSKSVVF